MPPIKPRLLLSRTPRTGILLVLGTSALGGAAYRYTTTPASSTSTSLNPQSFTPYTLLHKETVSSTSAIFTLRNPNTEGVDRDKKTLEQSYKDTIWSIGIKQPQLQIQRAYTPLPPPSLPSEPTNDIRLLIRREPSGEVSNYLHGLPLDSVIEVRGPRTECEVPRDIREVIFLAGGTGIATAMQVARVMGGREGTRMRVLWGSRRREDCVGGVGDGLGEGGAGGDEGDEGRGWRGWRGLDGRGKIMREEGKVERAEKGVIVRELEALKEESGARGNELSVEYFVDQENKFIKPTNVAKHLKVSREQDGEGQGGSKIIFVSGPDGFIEYWAGRKVWIGGREEQGRLGGVLQHMDLRGWSVFKL